MVAGSAAILRGAGMTAFANEFRMGGFELGEKLPYGTQPSLSRILQALTNAFLGVDFIQDALFFNRSSDHVSPFSKVTIAGLVRYELLKEFFIDLLYFERFFHPTSDVVPNHKAS